MPPFGLCLPVHITKVRDGDTVEVSLPGSTHVWAIRLVDCWAPESNTVEGKAAKIACQQAVDNADPASTAVFVPALRDCRNLLANVTFDRIPGYVYIRSDDTLNALLVRQGVACFTKEEQIQKFGPKKGQ